MIYGDDYVIGHIPRTGGTVTAIRFTLAQLVSPKRVLHVDNSRTKHQTFQQAGVPKNKRAMLALRRLPSWMMSWIVQMSGRLRPQDPITVTDFRSGNGGFGELWAPDGKPLPAPTMAQILGDEEWTLTPNYPLPSLADKFLIAFSDRPIEKIFMMEKLDDQLLEFFAEDFGWSEEEQDIYRPARRMNKEPLDYDHDPYNFFSEKEMERLYENNPVWANTELDLYGSLMLRREASV